MESVPPMNSNYLQLRYITIVFMGVIMVYSGPSSLAKLVYNSNNYGLW